MLLSLPLLAVGPQWAKEWSADHIPAIYDTARCGMYGHAYFAIGAGLSSVGTLVAILIRRRRRGTFSAAAVLVAGVALTTWLVSWFVVRGLTMCTVH